MNIAVCIKQVPDTTAKRELLPDFRLNRAAVDNVINPFDEYALEEALRLREQHGGEIAVVCMGPPSAEDAIRRALAMGADRAVLVTDPHLEGSDWSGTCTVLAKALARAPFDLILTGMESTDARSGLVPAGMAEALGLPVLTNAMQLDIVESEVHVQRQIPGGSAQIISTMPCVVSVVKGANDPRYPSLKGIMAAKRKEVTRFSLADLGLDAANVGLAGARTVVRSAEARAPRTVGEVQRPDDAATAARLIADFLQDRKFI